MNDIWILPSGKWIVYSDEEDVIKDFKSLKELEIITSYHGVFKKHRAFQFSFGNNNELLRYICYKARFNYQDALKMKSSPGISYNSKFEIETQQPSLLVEVEPIRRKKR
ncbi:MAG: hypothetical protein HGA27_03630 [Peptococcaceae bacterium]|nr:hypothetical protein [Peptococcaceae bacterium]